jgi:phosphatidylglycerol:prolipoprotein diacylglycerol transferase
MWFDAPFLLTVSGFGAAALVARRRAVRFGLDLGNLDSLMKWMLIGGLVCGHLIVSLYHRLNPVTALDSWHVVWRQPSELLRVWHGWRLVGGVFGALMAALLWKHYRFESTVIVRLRGLFELEGYWFVRRAERVPLLALADVVLSVFPLAWAVHRAGSALTRERSELGLIDLLITTVLLLVVVVLWRGRFRAGTYVCLAGLTYAPARVALGFLVAGDAPLSMGPLTMTQWGFAFATLLSLGLFIWLRSTTDPRPAIA